MGKNWVLYHNKNNFANVIYSAMNLNVLLVVNILLNLTNPSCRWQCRFPVVCKVVVVGNRHFRGLWLFLVGKYGSIFLGSVSQGEPKILVEVA